MMTFAVRIDFAASLVQEPERARRVGEILSRPCLAALGRVSAHVGDREVGHAPTSANAIAAILGNAENSGVVLDTPRGSKLEAGGEIKNGIRETNEGATRFYGWFAFPLPDNPGPAVSTICELAVAVDAGAGFIGVEPDYRYAQNAALGSGVFTMRPGLTKERLRERGAREVYKWKRQDQLAGVEWGTFLGAQHLARLDLAAVRAAGAFERVELISPTLVFLQVTKDPADDLREDFAPKLQRARAALAPIMIDLSSS